MTFSDFLRRENSRVVFTRLELRIIEKQVQGIKLSQYEKNVLSRSIRPKLRFIEKCCAYSSQFRLKKGQESEKKISEALEEIKKYDGVAEVRVFGSYLTGKFDDKSDIDVSVEFRNTSKKKAGIFLKDISPLIPERISISVYNVLPESIKQEIKKNGRKIYSDNAEDRRDKTIMR